MLLGVFNFRESSYMPLVTLCREQKEAYVVVLAVMELHSGFQGQRRPVFVMRTSTEAFGGSPLQMLFITPLKEQWENGNNRDTEVRESYLE